VWRVSHGRAGVSSVSLSHEYTSPSGVTSELVSGAALSEVSADVQTYEGSAAADGTYHLLVRATNKAGTSSGEVESPAVVIDRTAAAFSGRTSFDSYADESTSLNLAATDSLSRVSEYRYIVGSVSDPYEYESGWTSFDTSAEGTSECAATVAFSGMKSVPEQLARLYVYYQVRNSAGIWSSVKMSPAIVVDHTAAVVSVDLQRPDYITSSTSVSGIGFEGVDGESGIKGYRLGIVKANADGTVTAPGSLDGTYSGAISDSATKVMQTVSGLSLSLQSGSFEDGAKYELYVSVENGAGTWSAPEAYKMSQVDLTAPNYRFEDSSIVLNAVATDGEAVGVETTSEDIVSVEYRLVGEDGVSYDSQTYTSAYPAPYASETREAFAPEYTFTQSERMSYTLYATVTDKAGWVSGGASATIRVNQAPVLSCDETLDTTPGKPGAITIDGMSDGDGDGSAFSLVVEYPDGDGSGGTVATETYQWLETGGLVTGSDGSVTSASDKSFAIAHRFYQNATSDEPYPQTSSYRVNLCLTDASGMSGETQTVRVVVKNTSAGKLYANEYWTGSHVMDGDITVPAEWKLTTIGGCTVVVSADETSDYEHTLYVAGSLESQDATSWGTGSSAKAWGGIVVTGSGTFAGTTIEQAERGVTIGPDAEVDLGAMEISEGQTGLHVLKAGQMIEGVSFTDLSEYGIKLESGASATVRDCQFTDVERIYYDPDTTVLSVDELNELGGNGDNK
jgi:hypothetical protein